VFAPIPDRAGRRPASLPSGRPDGRRHDGDRVGPPEAAQVQRPPAGEVEGEAHGGARPLLVGFERFFAELAPLSSGGAPDPEAFGELCVPELCSRFGVWFPGVTAG
jgi:hypothetical protein